MICPPTCPTSIYFSDSFAASRDSPAWVKNAAAFCASCWSFNFAPLAKATCYHSRKKPRPWQPASLFHESSSTWRRRLSLPLLQCIHEVHTGVFLLPQSYRVDFLAERTHQRFRLFYCERLCRFAQQFVMLRQVTAQFC